MPCGGISGGQIYGMFQIKGECFQCYMDILEPDDGLFVEEWDCVIHRNCLGNFLLTDEGKVVMNHGHSIMVPEKS